MQRVAGTGHDSNTTPMPSKPRDAIGLWRDLRKAMKQRYNCETEYCLVEKLPGVTRNDKNTLRGYFRPQKPDAWDKKPTTWLDSFNIEDVMHQYEQAFPTFDFIGPVPIDFDAKDGDWGQCIVNELCRLDIRKANSKGIKQIGIIFNLDPHDKPGSHWVCAFIDIPKSAAYYFDSYGLAPPDQVEVLLKRLHAQGIQNVVYNDVRVQYGNSECGCFCLITIICLLKGREFKDICSRDFMDDKTTNAFRDILFTTEKPRKEAIDVALEKYCI
jgi:hypothetical protein